MSQKVAQKGGRLTGSHRKALDQFVSFWGEMASRWGINRTMAQIHALLYASEVPLDTDEIMKRLSISRGNANMNLRSLIDWKLVYKVQQEGSRKDYYQAEKDVWHITAQIIKRREREELEPVMAQLQECRDMLPSPDKASAAEQVFRERIQNLIQLMEVFDGVTTSLLPFIQQKNAPIIRNLIEIADSLGAADRADDENS
ncbi:MAG: hypothetical protein R3282_06055 [Rhodothermales bacterium]|nr:hypothetical protein [Rhodothermales bacterium]